MSAPIAKVVGTPSSNSWSQVHSFSGGEKYKERLVAVVSLQIETDGLDHETPAQLGKKIFSCLEEEYIKKAESSSCFNALKQSLESICREFSPKSGLELAVSVMRERFIYLGVIGCARVAVKRNGEVPLLLLGKQGEVSAISGVGQEGDVYVLGTEKFFQRVATERLLGYLNKNEEPQEFVDQLVSEIPVASSPLIAAAVFKFVNASPAPTAEDVNTEAKSEEVVEEKPKAKQVRQGSFIRQLIEKVAYKLPAEEAVIVKNESKSRRTAVSIGIILLLLLASSIVFGVKQKKSQDYKLSYENQLLQAQSMYSDSLSQKDINPPRARELFLEATNMVEDLITQGVKDTRLDDLKNNLEAGSAVVLGKVDAKISVYRDLSLVRSGVVATKIAQDGNLVGILDTSGQRIIAVTTTNKETEVLAGPEKVGNVENIGVLGSDYYVFSDKGIVKVARKGGVETIAKPDSSLGPISDLEAFGTNLYVLDKSNGIWKYPIGSESTKQKWLKDSVELDFSKSVGMAADGSLWVLFENGEIVKFTRGTQDVFRVSGMDQKFNNPVAFYTDQGLDNLYVLDKGNARIVEISKNGEFKKEYKGEGISDGNGLVVSKDAGSIFLLTENKVLEIKL